MVCMGTHGPNYMYSMNWETCTFMHVRHVPTQGTLSGGGNPLLLYTPCGGVSCQGSAEPTSFKLRGGCHICRVKGGEAQGQTTGRRAKKHAPGRIKVWG